MSIKSLRLSRTVREAQLVKSYGKDYSTAIMAAKTYGLQVPMDAETSAMTHVAKTVGAESKDGGEWSVGEYVEAGQTRTYAGTAYSCIQPHITQSDWTPESTPALWKQEQADWEEWKKPTGAHNAYDKGARITYNGKRYMSLIEGNAYSPDEYPAGWEEVQL